MPTVYLLTKNGSVDLVLSRDAWEKVKEADRKGLTEEQERGIIEFIKETDKFYKGDEMKITLYDYDEFPISYDTENREMVCVGYCSLCPIKQKCNTYEECKKFIESEVERRLGQCQTE